MTGGAGFIGYHLCKSLLDDHKVTIFDNLNEYYNLKLKEKNLKDLETLGANFIKGDILNYDSLIKNFDNYDVVFHLAAQPGVRYSSEHPMITNKINIEGTLNVLEMIKKNPKSKLIFSSSSSVFGDVGAISIRENTPRVPISIYGVSKVACEDYVSHYMKHYKLEIVTIRPFTVSGERQRPDMALFKFIDGIIKDKELTIFGDGKQTRDWGNVKNIAKAFKSSAEMDEAIGETFNIGNEKSHSVLNVIKLISKYLNKKPKMKFLNKSLIEPTHTLANISKAKKILKYSPKYNLEDAIKSEINFYMENKEIFG